MRRVFVRVARTPFERIMFVHELYFQEPGSFGFYLIKSRRKSFLCPSQINEWIQSTVSAEVPSWPRRGTTPRSRTGSMFVLIPWSCASNVRPGCIQRGAVDTFRHDPRLSYIGLSKCPATMARLCWLRGLALSILSVRPGVLPRHHRCWRSISVAEHQRPSASS